MSVTDHTNGNNQTPSPPPMIEDKTGVITVRMSHEMRHRLNVAAVMQGRSLNQIAVELLEAWLRDQPQVELPARPPHHPPVNPPREGSD